MNAVVKFEKQNIQQRMAARFGVDEREVLAVLKQTAFRVKGNNAEQASDAQMTALMIVADQYGLNPFTKELYAYPDKQNGIVPVVSVDGWARIINEHRAMNGIEFRYADESVTMKDGKPCPAWCEAVITRKDREKPIVIREYLDEVYCNKRNDYGGPWQSHTKRMLRHKTLIQGARIAFGFAGIYDEDEAERIIERDVTAEGSHATVTATVASAQTSLWSETDFEANYPKWAGIISRGKKTADEVIATATQKHQFTAEQEKKLRAVVPNPSVTDEQMELITTLARDATITIDEIRKQFAIPEGAPFPASLVKNILAFIDNPVPEEA